MKKFLSLVMALVMVMSLVTISAGAKDFTDNDSITYDEAVAVVSEVGIVDGYTDGKFNPTNTLTRQAAAKIICNLILGPTTAAELHADTAPYKDVAVNNEFAGYIAYCQSRGIISGYADGNFRPGNTLTGYAFMKMLLGALGYDSTLEGYVGANWSINVAKQALGIGLNKGLDGEFNGIKAVTREEACLYAFRTLQADLVEYNQRVTTTINGTEVTLSSGGAQAKKWANQTQQTRINNIREDEIIQFAEEYFRKLEKKKDTDDFERPAYTWVYDKEEIGTYVDWELMVAEYTTGVSGRDLYDLLGVTTLRDNELVYYVDGLVPAANHPATHVGANNNITLANITRGNQDDVGITSDGVLTQVFVDKDFTEDEGRITITSIDTWLGQADGDYKEATEYASIDVWIDCLPLVIDRFNVDVEDVPSVVDVKDEDFYLVNITYKHSNDGEIVAIAEPEILEESAVTKFSASNGHWGNTADTTSRVTKLTTSGTEYNDAFRAYYDDDILAEYDDNLLTDASYNIFLDPYGYFIGVELYEGTKNYVFITGFDRPKSNLTIQTATAAGIFLDGTMKTLTVNVSATNNNIEDITPTNGFTAANPGGAGEQYFQRWRNDLQVVPGDDGMYALNRWFTYSVNEAGVYTLKPATRMTITNVRDYANYDAQRDNIIRTDNLYLDDTVMTDDGYLYGELTSGAYAAGAVTANDWHNRVGATTALLYTAVGNPDGTYTKTFNERVYGNDDSVYITVDMDEVDTTNGASWAITEVNGVYTGVQNVEIEVDTTAAIQEGQVYSVYDRNNYIIGSVAVGEGNGGNATIAYILGNAKSERIEDGIYYWEFDAVIEGEKQTMTVKSNYRDVFNVLQRESNTWHKADGVPTSLSGATTAAKQAVARVTDLNEYDGLVELRWDSAKEYVVSVRPVEEEDIYSYYGNRTVTAAVKTSDYMGANSIVATTAPGYGAPYDANAYTNITLRDDAKAYRIGGINANTIGSAQTWNDGTAIHHYDSAPQELTLVGRTLYTTPRTGSNSHIDEGLAIAADAKAVVVQEENGKWKETQFSSVASALSHLADADPDATGLQYNGEVVAVMDGKGAAAWVVFTNYTELTTGQGAIVPGNNVTNLAVEYFNPDYNVPLGTPNLRTDDEFTGFILYGTQAGRTYTVTMTIMINGLQSRERVMRVNGMNGNTVVTGQNAFLGALDAGTSILLECGDMSATYYVTGTEGGLYGRWL